jgi:hypothetical protein
MNPARSYWLAQNSPPGLALKFEGHAGFARTHSLRGARMQ